MSDDKTDTFMIECVKTRVSIRCCDAEARSLLQANFGAMQVSAREGEVISYNIRKDGGRYIVFRDDRALASSAANLGELVYRLESDLVVQLQYARPDHVFLHAAVLSDGQSSCILTGPSGAGKSTTCWGLLHHGYHYVSDELAPILKTDQSVAGYSHALCLKKAPPGDYPLPAGRLRTERGFHVPPECMPLGPLQAVPPLRDLVFIRFDARSSEPAIKPVTTAEATARLYPNILNALAHPAGGLSAATDIVSQLNCFQLQAAGLGATCELLASRLAAA